MRRARRTLRGIAHNGALILLSLVFVYPFLWLLLGSFKTNEEIFASSLSLPRGLDFDVFARAWKGVGRYGFDTFFINTFLIVIPVVAFTLASALVVAYGFSRFAFWGKGPLFALMISTMMLPSSVILIPRYMMFSKFGWIDTYLPLVVPAIFGGGPFFIFLMIQFFRGLPRELDEAATIDGCGSLGILVHILAPLSKPALFSMGVFQFMWTWNDFFNQLIYINSVSKYTLALGLRMSLDMTTNVQWNEVFAMSLVSIAPPVVLFFLAQKYFVEGIATSGLK